VCDQHSTQCSPSREPVPSLTDLGDSLQVIWDHYHQHNGPQEHWLLHLNQWLWWVQNNLGYQVCVVGTPSHAVLVDEYTGDFPTLYRSQFTALHGGHCSMLHACYTAIHN
jgi:hypothetical protein